MELQMETKTSTTKPEPSVTDDDEHSPLMEEVNSSELPSQPEPVPVATVSADSSNVRRCWVCELIFTIVLMLLFLSIIIVPPFLPLLLAKKPPPDPRNIAPTFHVDSVAVSSLNLSNCQVFSNWNISFIVKNPEHGYPLFYDAIRVLVLYENEYFLSTGNVESFYLRGGQEYVMKAWAGGSSVSVEKWVANAIETDRNIRREMDIVLVLDALVIVNPGSEELRRRLSMKATCYNLRLKLSSDDSAAGSMSSSRSSRNFCYLKIEDWP